MSTATADKMNLMLRGVVTDGTGETAAVNGYTVMGKTGTARKPQPGGGYTDAEDRRAPSTSPPSSGVVPAEAPALSVIVVIDEPSGGNYPAAPWRPRRSRRSPRSACASSRCRRRSPTSPTAGLPCGPLSAGHAGRDGARPTASSERRRRASPRWRSRPRRRPRRPARVHRGRRPREDDDHHDGVQPTEHRRARRPPRSRRGAAVLLRDLIQRSARARRPCLARCRARRRRHRDRPRLARRAAGQPLLLHPRRARRRPRARRRRGRAAVPWRCSSSTARPRRALPGRARHPAGDGAAGGAVQRRPGLVDDGRRRHRHQRQDDDHLPAARHLRGGRAARPRWSARCRAPAPRPRRPSCRPGWPACATVGSTVGGHGGVVARAGACTGSTAPGSPSAVFTNLSRDHLDFHETMEAYFEAKARLFEPELAEPGGRQPRRPLRPPAARRGQDPDHRATRSTTSPTSWSARPAAGSPGGARRSSSASAAASTSPTPWPRPRRRWPSGSIRPTVAAGLSRPHPGARAASSWSRPASRSRSSSTTPTPPTGSSRCSPRSATSTGAGAVTVVFGCGGDRDATKRPAMGEVAAALADRVVLTADNPRGEDTGAIIDAVSTGSERTAERRATELLVEPDRRRAIALALAAARPGDVVVIAGKGHETTQTIGDTVVPFDDREVARVELARLAPRRTATPRDPPPRRGRHRAGRVARRHPVPDRLAHHATGSASRSTRTARRAT